MRSVVNALETFPNYLFIIQALIDFLVLALLRHISVEAIRTRNFTICFNKLYVCFAGLAEFLAVPKATALLAKPRINGVNKSQRFPHYPDSFVHWKLLILLRRAPDVYSTRSNTGYLIHRYWSWSIRLLKEVDNILFIYVICAKYNYTGVQQLLLLDFDVFYFFSYGFRKPLRFFLRGSVDDSGIDVNFL